MKYSPLLLLILTLFSIPVLAKQQSATEIIKDGISNGKSLSEILPRVRHINLTMEEKQLVTHLIEGKTSESNCGTCWAHCMLQNTLAECCHGDVCIGSCADGPCIGRANSADELTSLYCWIKCFFHHGSHNSIAPEPPVYCNEPGC